MSARSLKRPILRTLAIAADALAIPPWALLIDGLRDHPELLRPGALAGLCSVVRAYLAAGDSERTAIEAAARGAAPMELRE